MDSRIQRGDFSEQSRNAALGVLRIVFLAQPFDFALLLGEHDVVVQPGPALLLLLRPPVFSAPGLVGRRGGLVVIFDGRLKRTGIIAAVSRLLTDGIPLP